jgi:hypothetical protein
MILDELPSLPPEDYPALLSEYPLALSQMIFQLAPG